MTAVYMEIDRNNKDLPLAIADSPAELAKIVGVKPNIIHMACNQSKAGKHRRFIKVEIPDEDESEDEGK